MPRSHKPIIWSLFAAGGTVAAFLVPVLILITFFAVPFGLLPADALSYERLLSIMQHAFVKQVVFGVISLVIWHAAHRMRITTHDLGIRNDKVVMLICYGIAAASTILALVALLGI